MLRLLKRFSAFLTSSLNLSPIDFEVQVPSVGTRNLVIALVPLVGHVNRIDDDTIESSPHAERDRPHGIAEASRRNPRFAKGGILNTRDLHERCAFDVIFFLRTQPLIEQEWELRLTRCDIWRNPVADERPEIGICHQSRSHHFFDGHCLAHSFGFALRATRSMASPSSLANV